jgi:hypothetical protein
MELYHFHVKKGAVGGLVWLFWGCHIKRSITQRPLKDLISKEPIAIFRYDGWLRKYNSEGRWFEYRPVPSNRNTPLGSTQLRTEKSTRKYSSCKGRPVRKADNFTAICEQIAQKIWEVRRLKNMQSYKAYHRDNHLWRSASSGMLHRVALVRSDVSDDLSVSIIRVTRIGELGTTVAVTSNRQQLTLFLVHRFLSTSWRWR